MIVKTGWNSEFAREKFDVGLGEEDLPRILDEAGIPPDAHLTVSEAFRVLYFSAENFSEMVKATQLKDADAKMAAVAAAAHRDSVLDKIKARLGLMGQGVDQS